MAINPSLAYPGQITAPDANYTYGAAKNVSAPLDGTGTPWEQNFQNDLFGLLQFLLVDNGIVPSGIPETVLVSQYYDALRQSVSVYKNVRAFGAKGDGTTDDTTAIQNAIDRVDTEGGGGIYFPHGTYLTQNLNVSGNTTLMGIGGSLLLKSGSDSPLVTVLAGSEQVRISNLKMDGQAALNVGTAVTDGLILLQSTSASPIKDVRIENCIIFDPDQHAIQINDGAERINITGCTLEGTADSVGGGISVASTTGNTDGIIITGNHIFGFEGDGIFQGSGGAVHNLQILGNKIDGVGGAGTSGNINIQGSSNLEVLIADNLLVNGAMFGVAIQSQGGTLRDNVIGDFGTTGISVAASVQISIIGNKIFGSGTVDGIFATDAIGILVANNLISISSSFGIQIIRADVGSPGVAYESSVIGNTIAGGVAGGILINGGIGVKNCIIEGNRCVGATTGNGIQLTAVEDSVCTSNRVDTYATGILESGACDFNTVSTNVARGSTTPITTVGAGTVKVGNVV